MKSLIKQVPSVAHNAHMVLARMKIQMRLLKKR
jgi:hypothetical protein